MQTGQLEDSIADEGSDKRIQGSGQRAAKEKLDSSLGDSIGVGYSKEASAAGPGRLSICFPYALCICGYTSIWPNSGLVMVCDVNT